MLLQFCCYCPNNTDLTYLLDCSWTLRQQFYHNVRSCSRTSSEPPTSLAQVPSSPYPSLCTYTTFLLHFTAQSLSFTKLLKNSSVIINNSKLFRTVMNDIRYSTLTASFMHMLTTMGLRRDMFANSLEKLQHFAWPDFLQRPGWLLTLQEVYPCIQ